MSTTVYHHIEHAPTPIEFEMGGLSTEDHEYFVLSIGTASVFCTREQAETMLSRIQTWFDAEYLTKEARTIDVLAV
jgi:hypothetical protein